MALVNSSGRLTSSYSLDNIYRGLIVLHLMDCRVENKTPISISSSHNIDASGSSSPKAQGIGARQFEKPLSDNSSSRKARVATRFVKVTHVYLWDT